MHLDAYFGCELISLHPLFEMSTSVRANCVDAFGAFAAFAHVGFNGSFLFANLQIEAFDSFDKNCSSFDGH